MRFFLILMLAMIAGTPGNAQVMAPIATQSKGVVSRSGVPFVGTKVPASAIYLGSERFALFDIADCELHVFVDVDEARRVKRLYWVQFEEYLPGVPDHQYDYARDSERRTIWGETVWVRSRFYASDIQTRPGSDLDRVREMVKRAGYELPPYLMYARFVRLLGDDNEVGRGRRELMMIYAEDMIGAGYKPDDYVANNDISENWSPHREALIARGAKAMEMQIR